MLKASHCIAIALAFLVAASLRASAGERPGARHSGRITTSAAVADASSHAPRGLPWRLVFR